MFATTLPSEQASDSALQRLRGEARVAFSAEGGATRLADLYQQTPCRIQFPRTDGPWPEAVLLNTAGGVTGGDRLAYDIAVRGQAQAVASTQAAEKIYRALDDKARIRTRLAVEEDCELHWLPQETIVFNRANLARETRANVAAGGRLLALDWLILGRQAHGETVTEGTIHDRWRIYREDRLIWADDFRLAGAIDDLVRRPAILDGARAQATVVYVADDSASQLESAREWLGTAAVRTGATTFDHLLLVRFLADDPAVLRSEVGSFVTKLRSSLAGNAVALPRVWSC